MSTPNIAIVDYGLGNLFSLSRACEHAGMRPVVTSSSTEMARADAVILPGVGAFGDAMSSLRKMDLVDPLRELAGAGHPLIGICLGMQLLLSRSNEFGEHEGLGIIEGSVRGFADEAVTLAADATTEPIKIPQVGWNRVFTPGFTGEDQHDVASSESLMSGLPSGVFMYFVHSYIAEPAVESIVTGRSRYGGIEFCSALRLGNVVGFQFHPERSGEQGLRIYQNIASWLNEN